LSVKLFSGFLSFSFARIADVDVESAGLSFGTVLPDFQRDLRGPSRIFSPASSLSGFSDSDPVTYKSILKEHVRKRKC
jgi:hypothetical protein